MSFQCLFGKVERDEMRHMIVEDSTLYEHLHKLVGLKSEQEFENLLKLLWQTRRTGLCSPQKSSIQSLLGLSSLIDLDPVLACLRCFLRKCLHENLDGDEILKLLPPDLALELQSMLIITLQKHQNQWKRELSQEQHLFEGTRFSHQLNTNLPEPLLSFSSPNVSGSLLPQQVDPVPQFNGHNLGGPTSVTAERNAVGIPRLTLSNDGFPSDILGVHPRLKSMTWTVENKSVMSANRVAIITLKLQDYAKSPSMETEIKFQLTRDTLEAVLRSMTYINEQLSRSVGPSSVPLQKKQKRR